MPGSSPLIGKSLAEEQIPKETGTIVLALRRAGTEGPAMFNPGSETRIAADDVMVALGESNRLERLLEHAGAGS